MPFLFGFTPQKVILAFLKNKNILNGLKSGGKKPCIFFCPSEKMESVSSHYFCGVCLFMCVSTHAGGPLGPPMVHCGVL